MGSYINTSNAGFQSFRNSEYVDKFLRHLPPTATPSARSNQLVYRVVRQHGS